jgi:hypothetical protein
VYVGSEAATVGSSNFTDAGLSSQIEANARFERRTEPQRYSELVQVAENLWSAGQPWGSQFRDLLLSLLLFVPWREALARACGDLLEGAWADRNLPGETIGQSVVAIADLRDRPGPVDHRERGQRAHRRCDGLGEDADGRPTHTCCAGSTLEHRAG